MNKTKVLVVDDSAVIRQVMTEIIRSDSTLVLEAAVVDPIFAMKRMEMHWPDVIILDVEMPRMDGITFLKKIMSERPTPVVMCSTLTGAGTETALEAMSAGAIDIITKPKMGAKAHLLEENRTILNVIKAAAKARNLDKLRVKSNPIARYNVAKNFSADAILDKASGSMKETTERIVAIGTSTGGTQALEVVLTALPKVCPGTVVVQHMPEKFTAAFANRLNNICDVDVREAKNLDRVLPGVVLIAPGGKHMTLKRSGALYIVEVKDGPPVNRHRPSVDVLFRSVAKFAGKNSLGIIMTGMGDDGARGLLEMREVGAKTIGQNEESSIVYGMPKEAMKLGAVAEEIGLSNIAGKIMNFYRR